MRAASILAVSALALGFIHSPALAQSPPPTPQPTISEREEVRNTYIFKFADSVDRGEMHARARQAVAGTDGILRHVYTEVLGGFAATLPGSGVWNVARQPGIIAYERDEIFTIFAPPWCPDPDDPRCGGEDGDTGGGDAQTVPWGVKRIGAPADKTGLGIHVYVIDSGIQPHDDLVIKGSWNCTRGCADNMPGEDKNGHGTHVAGTVGALNNDVHVVGVAPEVSLYSVQVLKPGGTGSLSDIIAGVELVAEKAGLGSGPVVANMSLGGSGSKGSETCTKDGFNGTSMFYKAICDAANAGVVLVVAAGNSGADAAGFVPAAYDDAVITVSATQKGDDWPSWSNWGDDSASWTSNVSAPVAIAAPGASIESTDKGGGTSTKSGTSMASPHVAGVAALLIDGGAVTSERFTADKYNAFRDVRDAILKSAESTGAWNSNNDDPHDEDFACAAGANCGK
jgi:subtilisin